MRMPWGKNNDNIREVLELKIRELGDRRERARVLETAEFQGGFALVIDHFKRKQQAMSERIDGENGQNVDMSYVAGKNAVIFDIERAPEQIVADILNKQMAYESQYKSAFTNKEAIRKLAEEA